MAKILTLNEMLDCLQLMKHPGVPKYRLCLEARGDLMATEIRNGLSVDSGDCNTDNAELGGTAVPFYAKTKGQPIPEAMAYFDATDESGDQNWYTKKEADSHNDDGEDNPFHPESPEGRAWEAGDRSSIT